MNSWLVRYNPGIWIIHHKKDKITIGSFVLVTIIEENAEVCQLFAFALTNRIQYAKKEYNSDEDYWIGTLEEGEKYVWTIHTSCRYQNRC
jgi:hypothetical protein